MPLVFKRKNPTRAEEKRWAGLDYSPSCNLFVWRDQPTIAGDNMVVSGVSSLAQQSRVLARHFFAFAYNDNAPLDHGDGNHVHSFAQMLEARGDRPDFTKQTLERGILLRNGDFIGCGFAGHIDLLRYTLNLDMRAAEDAGCVMVQPFEAMRMNPDKELSAAQKKTLGELGFDDGMLRTQSPEFTAAFEEIRQRQVTLPDDYLHTKPLEDDVVCDILQGFDGAKYRFSPTALPVQAKKRSGLCFKFW